MPGLREERTRSLALAPAPNARSGARLTRTTLISKSTPSAPSYASCAGPGSAPTPERRGMQKEDDAGVTGLAANSRRPGLGPSSSAARHVSALAADRVVQLADDGADVARLSSSAHSGPRSGRRGGAERVPRHCIAMRDNSPPRSAALAFMAYARLRLWEPAPGPGTPTPPPRWARRRSCSACSAPRAAPPRRATPKHANTHDRTFQRRGACQPRSRSEVPNSPCSPSFDFIHRTSTVNDANREHLDVTHARETARHDAPCKARRREEHASCEAAPARCGLLH